MRAGGSSIVFNSAFAAVSFRRSAPKRMTTLRSVSIGLACASRINACASRTSTWFPTGSISTTSGCVTAADEVPHPVVVRRDERGREAPRRVARRPSRAARRAGTRARDGRRRAGAARPHGPARRHGPTRSSSRRELLLDDRPDPGRHLLDALATRRRPTTPASLRQIAVRLVDRERERVVLALEAVTFVAAEPPAAPPRPRARGRARRRGRAPSPAVASSFSCSTSATPRPRPTPWYASDDGMKRSLTTHAPRCERRAARPPRCARRGPRP